MASDLAVLTWVRACLRPLPSSRSSPPPAAELIGGESDRVASSVRLRFGPQTPDYIKTQTSQHLGAGGSDLLLSSLSTLSCRSLASVLAVLYALRTDLSSVLCPVLTYLHHTRPALPCLLSCCALCHPVRQIPFSFPGYSRLLSACTQRHDRIQLLGSRHPAGRAAGHGDRDGIESAAVRRRRIRLTGTGPGRSGERGQDRRDWPGRGLGRDQDGRCGAGWGGRAAQVEGSENRQCLSNVPTTRRTSTAAVCTLPTLHGVTLGRRSETCEVN